nr:PhnD/SsuA/transferrin family substrate-binding protein [bacterium]
MRRLLPIFVFAIVSSTLLLSACGRSDTEQVLRFSAIPDQNSTEMTEKFTPFAEYLSEVLGVSVQYVPSRDYQAAVEMFKNGDIQLAWFGGLTGVQAREGLDGARAIAQGAVDPEYFSYFIAHGSLGRIQHPNFPTYIRELKFTFGSESSTSGRLMPEYFIRKYTKYKSTSYFKNTAFYSG